MALMTSTKGLFPRLVGLVLGQTGVVCIRFVTCTGSALVWLTWNSLCCTCWWRLLPMMPGCPGSPHKKGRGGGGTGNNGRL